jgi:hypothetical protein
MLVDNIGKPVPPDRVVPSKVAPVHMPEFVSSYTRIFSPDVFDILQSESFPGYPGQDL